MFISGFSVKKVSEKQGITGSEKGVNASQKIETISEKPIQTIESNNKKRYVFHLICMLTKNNG